MKNAPNTPVVIGVGQSVDRLDSPNYQCWSAADLAAQAARNAFADCTAPAALLARIDAIVTTRTFEDFYGAPAPFGKSSNFPRSVAKRLGINPPHAIWSQGGGNSPQDLVNEFCQRIAQGEFEAVLLCGGEAISTIRNAQRTGQTLDFGEDPDGEVEDRTSGIDKFREELARRHGILNASIGYALAENARRAHLGLSRVDYALEMGRLFAPFAATAATNPMSAWDVPSYSAEELATVTGGNRWVADPFPIRMVSRDQVNLGAAILIASRRVAEEVGIPAEKVVYLHGHAHATEKPFLERPDIGSSPAARRTARLAIERAGITVADIAAFDFYSCFPIAVSNVAIDELGLSADDPRKLTVTGGLPFFGGPGNNYAMHAIAEMVKVVRARPGAAGLVGANGGWLSKYSVGIYSAVPRPWRDWRDEALQAELDAAPALTPDATFAGHGWIETYTIFSVKGTPRYAVILGRSSEGLRFIARTAESDDETIKAMQDSDPLGRLVYVHSDADGVCHFHFLEEGS
ncbi:hypothetical protein [Acetobacter sacchari]|nr:hypothetical protein [Acetobacter sacchari]